jgi:outer membrane biogenesis lipoprotein LolB
VRNSILQVAGVLLLSACTTVSPALPLPPSDPRPQAFVADLADLAEQRRSMRGVARVAVDSEDGQVSIRANQRLVVERPGRLRVEVLGFLSATAAVLATDGERYEFFLAEDRSYQSGPVHPHLLWEVSRIALPPEEVVDLVLGAPLPEVEYQLGPALVSGDGRIEVTLTDLAGAQLRTVAFDKMGLLRRVDVFARGRIAWTAHFDDYAGVGDRFFAHTLLVEFISARTTAEVSLRDVEINPDLQDDVFHLQLAPFEGPPGG